MVASFTPHAKRRTGPQLTQGNVNAGTRRKPTSGARRPARPTTHATAPAPRPSWDRLFELASAQAGYFTTQQAATAGYSSQLLLKHIRGRRVIRAQRGIYRLVHFPFGEHEELATVWLWTELAGVMSHQTALALHGLSDALPAQIYLTLPAAWHHRRLRVPPGVILHYSDVSPNARTWFGPVPATTVSRTLNDCAQSGLSPELLRQAARQALQRGLVTRQELHAVATALAPFGGLA